MTAGQPPSDEEMDLLVRQFCQLLLPRINFQSQKQTCIYALLAETYTEKLPSVLPTKSNILAKSTVH